MNPNTTPIEEDLPLCKFRASGIISSHIMYNIVPPAKDKHRDINVGDIIPIYPPKKAPIPVGIPVNIV